jgi:predicted metal-dependent hydrolase
MNVDTIESSRVPRPRSPGVDLEAAIPRHWFGENAVATHIANGVNLLFPAGERFFVRSVKHYLDEITEPTLRAQIKGFFGQEGRHAHEHERVFRLLEEQGYDVQRFLKLYEHISYDIIERYTSPALHLAVTAACEHYTAILAENALKLRVLDYAHPTMRALLLWHAAEEIEHRSVAFDVLRQVNPSYALRMAGLAIATVTLAGFWFMATQSLLGQERERMGLTRASMRSQWRDARARRGKVSGVFLVGIREYMRPDFHPSQRDTDRLATDYLASVGLT